MSELSGQFTSGANKKMSKKLRADKKAQAWQSISVARRRGRNRVKTRTESNIRTRRRDKSRFRRRSLQYQSNWVLTN